MPSQRRLPRTPRYTVIAVLAVVIAGTACASPFAGQRAAPAVPHPTATATTTTTTTTATVTLGSARYSPRVLAHGAGSPDDLTLDGQGNLIFSDQADGTIRRIEVDQSGRVDVLLQGLNEPEGVIALPDGAVYIAVQGQNGQGVDKIEVLPHHAATLAPLTSFSNHTNMPGLDGISLDPTTSDLLVADSPNGKIYRVTLNGAFEVQSTTLVASGFVRPTDAIADRAGNIYVADEYGNRVERIAPNGTVTTLARLSLPDDLAFDVDGTLLVTSLQTNQLLRLNPTTGQVLATLASDLHEPQGLAVDGAGNLYVSEELANTIVEFARG